MKAPPNKLAIIVSRFNPTVTERLLMGAKERLDELAIGDDEVDVVKVPGAVEIPLMAQQLAMTRQYSAIVCLGAVIRGETDHYDYVCQQVSDGCQHVSLKYHVPVIFGILTTQNEELALARAGGEYGNKGRDAIDAAISMVKILQQHQSKISEPVETAHA